MKKLTLMLAFVLMCLAGCGSMNSSGSTSVSADNTSPANISGSDQKSNDANWHKLQHTPLPTLQEAEASNQDPTEKGWMALAVISKKYSTNSPQLIHELRSWRNSYPNHPGNTLFPDDSELNSLANQPAPQHIAILLPLHGPMADSGKIVRNGFMSAYYDSKGNNDSSKQAISFYDTNESPDIGAIYQKALDQGADLIIGPLSKPQVEALRLVNQFKVPVLALNYANTSVFSSTPSNFYEFGLSPAEETAQMADKARRAGLSHALVIVPDDAWGQRVTTALNSSWKANGGDILDTLSYKPQSNLTQDIAKLLHINPKDDQNLAREDNKKSTLAEQRRQDFDVIFLFAQPDMARQIVPLLHFYYTGNVPIYSISSIYSGRPNPLKDKDINGVTFCEIPWIIQMAHSENGAPGQYDRLYAIGRDAYLLSQSIPRLNAMPNFPIYGATGALAMDQQQIHQRLPWVTMHGGRI